MKTAYLQPETRVVDLLFESGFLQSGGNGTGIGTGSDMDDPDDTQNPF